MLKIIKTVQLITKHLLGYKYRANKKFILVKLLLLKKLRNKITPSIKIHKIGCHINKFNIKTRKIATLILKLISIYRNKKNYKNPQHKLLKSEKMKNTFNKINNKF